MKCPIETLTRPTWARPVGVSEGLPDVVGLEIFREFSALLRSVVWQYDIKESLSAEKVIFRNWSSCGEISDWVSLKELRKASIIMNM